MVNRIILIDDHQVVLDGIKLYLNKIEGLHVVGTATNGLDGMEMVLSQKPDLVILDVTMQGMNGLDLTKSIYDKLPKTKICVLSMHTERKYVTGIIEAGASGYVAKSDNVGELGCAIEAILSGKRYFSQKVAENIPGELEPSARGKTCDQLASLSKMDRQVLQFVAEGMSSKEIAKLLFCTKKTIDYHRQSIMRKLRIPSVAGLTKYAVEQGITTLERQ